MQEEPVSVMPIMNMVSGLWVSQTLVTAHERDVFGRFAKRPGMTSAQLADEMGLEERPVEQLVTACAGLGLLERDGEGYRNTPMTDRYLLRGGEDYVGGWVEIVSRHDYPGWLRLGEALRTNRPTAWDSERRDSLFDDENPVVVESFWEGMSAISRPTARALADAVDLSGDLSLLDVGGGGGAYAIELSRAYPSLRATIFDLPFVCDLTRKKVEQAGFGNRISFAAGDFFTDQLPSDQDVVLLSMILHDWDVDQCKSILRSCYEALAPGGRLLISELLVADTKDGPLDATLMSLSMLVETFGRNYTGAEYRDWLLETGFTDVEIRPFAAPAANGVVVARKP
ncbi:methyltransferase [Streptomyces viridosporus]|uniref:Methyltransferase domain-containing protein n=1 Tax=Streptomyces viridosporus T7A TaxID=665577 RepID=A0ABX6AN69_STRVD|nr:methyltransferase [Streptomyces sp. NWU49]PWJ05329.1 methyltransferase domain-containing protein [Streptomyces sp. NWU49]QEU89025.1 methyltransferase domain-containing protein [Streptomyces viridosporus T7A]